MAPPEEGRPGSGFTATADQAERRLDRVLRGMYGEIPLTAIMKAVRVGAVRVNGTKQTAGFRLSAGDVVDTPWQPPGTGVSANPERKEYAPAEALRTLYRNRDIWCVEKPVGLLSQPDKTTRDSLVSRAWCELAWERLDFRPALISRLDRNVSGVTVVAMNAPSLRLLSELMREGRIRKTYVAVVHGTPGGKGEIRAPLCKDERTNTVRVDPAGRESLTRYRTIRTGKGLSLLELELVTGRPHQARVHLSHMGHPILGDAKYGGKRGVGGPASRLFLHAHAVLFPDVPELAPDIRGREVVSQIPKEFADLFGSSLHHQ